LSTQVFTFAPFCFYTSILTQTPPSEEIVLLESQAEEDAKNDTRTDAAGHFSPQVLLSLPFLKTSIES
jgi:hypothetical protein